MQSITLSENLHIFLKAKATGAHGGSINNFLCSHFRVRSLYETNADTAIRDLPKTGSFRLTLDLHKRYELFLQTLQASCTARLEHLDNFRWPLSGNRIVLGSNPRVMKRPKQLLDSEHYYCLGFSETEYKDLVFHLMRELRYPFPVCQELRHAFTVERANEDFLDTIKDLYP